MIVNNDNNSFFFFQTICQLKMMVFNNKASYCESILTDLLSERLPGDDFVKLVSHDEQEYVHISLLRNVSPFLNGIISPENNIIILPSCPTLCLHALVTLLHTGYVPGLDQQKAEQVMILVQALGLDNVSREMDTTMDETVITADRSESVEKTTETGEERKLKTETEMVDKTNSVKVSLSLPKSRRNRKTLEIEQMMSGFNGRIQQEYNLHPVGQYMGPYDQNRNLKLDIQLPEANLDFEKYTEFCHDGAECFQLGLKFYKRYEDHEKINSYRIVSVLSQADSSSTSTGSEEEENDLKSYTCQLGRCKIPCPCPQCHKNQAQCPEHKIQHEALFDEKNHAISIRSTEEFCRENTFFNKSYIIKYSGIPLDCKECQQDLLYHHSYHFEYHDKCRFCKQSWFKYKAKSSEELKILKKKEIDYFKCVCPYCDKQFMKESNVKLHIKHTHKNGQLKCEKCEKLFSSPQARDYHDKRMHSRNVYLR